LHTINGDWYESALRLVRRILGLDCHTTITAITTIATATSIAITIATTIPSSTAWFHQCMHFQHAWFVLNPFPHCM
jgi:hypothetical protein